MQTLHLDPDVDARAGWPMVAPREEGPEHQAEGNSGPGRSGRRGPRPGRGRIRGTLGRSEPDARPPARADRAVRRDLRRDDGGVNGHCAAVAPCDPGASVSAATAAAAGRPTGPPCTP